jgi:carboxyl-terminal processing protease
MVKGSSDGSDDCESKQPRLSGTIPFPYLCTLYSPRTRLLYNSAGANYDNIRYIYSEQAIKNGGLIVICNYYIIRNMKKFILILFPVILGFSTCKKDVAPATTTTDTTSVVKPTVDELARDYLYTAMNQYYFWYKLMPVVVKTDYKDPYTLLNAMEYKTLDRWSFIQTYDEYVAMSTGSFVGHGISMGLDPDKQVRIAQIYSNSPLYLKGVRRGWIVKKLNGKDLAPIFISKDGTAYSNLIGASTAGITNTFLFQTPAGKDSTIISTKATFTLNTVLVKDTLHLKSGITGHLVFDQFITPSNQELLTAFTYFNQNNIKDLIVDLRYNGGGDLSVLTNMASYVAGASKAGSKFVTLTFNDKNTASNVSYNFNAVSSPVNISRLIVITTRGTASASEDFINGLRPVMNEIKTIGDTTNGKPVGMIGIAYKTNYMFWPISFSLVNSAGSGDFYKGIVPDKYVLDDITHDWTDRSESCLKEAIYYLEHGTVSAKSLSAGTKASPLIFSEKSSKSNNAYIINK